MNNYPIMHCAIDLLPKSRHWTRAEREKWLALIEYLVDYLIKVTEPEQPETSGDLRSLISASRESADV